MKNHDHGRFIIKNVVYQPACSGSNEATIITVLNGVHGSSNPKSSTSDATFPYKVRIHFGNDTVGFDLNHMIDGSTPSGSDYHRFHEIYVTKEATTFSHERARMPIQSAIGNDLGTDNWHINYVSPKLRGYRDTGSSNLNRYIRLKTLSYDATSGEFEVQIGQRSTGISVLNPGATVRSRKNVPFRVYDETGNDYIELVYIETASSATAIGVGKVVDIEIFASLALDDEVLLLSTAELNWDPSDDLLVDRVFDQRPVGSISELEFTKSAIDFITAGDRAIHANGVIQGLSFVSVAAGDPAAMVFNGGMGLINGRVVPVNNGKVVIPELVPQGGSSGSTVDWIICVNEDGKFVSLPITSTKQQFFAEAGTGGGTPYYIPSVTFTEIINERKDLLPIYAVTATITSVALGTPTDVRRFVYNSDIHGYSISVLDGYNIENNATFRSFESLNYWVNNFGVSDVEIKSIDTTDNVDLSFTNTCRLHGGSITFGGTGTIGNAIIEGCSLTINASHISVSNSELKNCDISVTYSDGLQLAGSKLERCNLLYNPPALVYADPNALAV